MTTWTTGNKSFEITPKRGAITTNFHGQSPRSNSFRRGPANGGVGASWHAQMAPIHIIEQSPFCSFFFRPTSREPHVTTLYMHIWCGVHMAYYLRHRDQNAARAFMGVVGLPDAFHEALRAIPVCLRGQGDWKCETCGPMPGTVTRVSPLPRPHGDMA